MIAVLLAYAVLWAILLTFVTAAHVPELRVRLRPRGPHRDRR